MNKYDVSVEFTEGFIAALKPLFRDPAKSHIWLAGWDAGYKFRPQKNEEINKYLIANGFEPMAIIRTCS